MDAFLKRIVVKAGDLAMKRIGKDRTYKLKSEHPSDVVTKADESTERFIVDAIKKKYPDHGVVGEELGGSPTDAEYVWVIDPIDGTANFAVGIPIFGTMIALTRKKKVIMGAIYLPLTQELFFARKGKGAYRNAKRVRASSLNSIRTSSGCVSSTMSDRTISFCEALYKVVRGKRVHLEAFGSIAFGVCTVARGARDWYVGSSPHFHDNAAVSIILSEAGYKVTDVHGKPVRAGSSGVVAARPKTHAQLLRLTKQTL